MPLDEIVFNNAAFRHTDSVTSRTRGGLVHEVLPYYTSCPSRGSAYPSVTATIDNKKHMVAAGNSDDDRILRALEPRQQLASIRTMPSLVFCFAWAELFASLVNAICWIR